MAGNSAAGSATPRTLPNVGAIDRMSIWPSGLPAGTPDPISMNVALRFGVAGK